MGGACYMSFNNIKSKRAASKANQSGGFGMGGGRKAASRGKR